MLVTILTLFPEMFPGALSHSLLGKALGKLWDLKVVNIRDFASDRHRTVDDTPYGGGAGMVMKPDVVDNALKYALSLYNCMPEIIHMTPHGKIFNHSIAKQISANSSGAIFLCGRYEGIDQRVIDYWMLNYNMREISIGDYILFGGEIPAMVVIEASLRFSKGIMNNENSVEDESFANGLLEYPQYTRPTSWNNIAVPDVLLSGNHKEISAWRTSQSEQITQSVRPDLWEMYQKARA